MNVDNKQIEAFYETFSDIWKERIDKTVEILVKAKQEGKQVNAAAERNT